MRICRLLYVELDKGKSKEEVEKLKQWLLRQVHHEDGGCVRAEIAPRAPQAPRLPSARAKAKVMAKQKAKAKAKAKAKLRARARAKAKAKLRAKAKAKLRARARHKALRRLMILRRGAPVEMLQESLEEGQKFRRLAEGRDTPLVRDIVKDFDQSNMEREDQKIDSIYRGRIGLSRNCPLRHQLRKNYDFVVAISQRGPRGAVQFSQHFHHAHPLGPGKRETNCDLCNQQCQSNLYLLRAFRRDTRPWRLTKHYMYCGGQCSRALLRKEKLSSGESSRVEILQWRKKLLEILKLDDWETRLNAEVLNAGESLVLLQKALRQVLGDRPGFGSRAPAPRPPRRPFERGPPLRRRRRFKALTDCLLDAKLPAGLKVERSSSLWTALARSIFPWKIQLLAERIQAFCAAKEETEEQQLKNFLQKAQLRAKIFDAQRPEGYLVDVANGQIIGTLKLCCIEGQFHGAGQGLSRDELSQLRSNLGDLFEGIDGEARSDRLCRVGGNAGNAAVGPAEDGGSTESEADAAKSDAADAEGDAEGDAAEPDPAVTELVLSRANQSVKLLEEALQKQEEARAAPEPSAVPEQRAAPEQRTAPEQRAALKQLRLPEPWWPPFWPALRPLEPVRRARAEAVGPSERRAPAKRKTVFLESPGIMGGIFQQRYLGSFIMPGIHGVWANEDGIVLTGEAKAVQRAEERLVLWLKGKAPSPVSCCW